MYETCRQHGALIITGHEHSYERTLLMSDLEHQIVASTNTTYAALLPGQTIAIVSGLGGNSVRPDNTHFPYCERSLFPKQHSSPDNCGRAGATTYNLGNGGRAAALFCVFNPRGQDERRAECYLKDIAGVVVDQFTLVSYL